MNFKVPPRKRILQMPKPIDKTLEFGFLNDPDGLSAYPAYDSSRTDPLARLRRLIDGRDQNTIDFTGRKRFRARVLRVDQLEGDHNTNIKFFNQRALVNATLGEKVKNGPKFGVYARVDLFDSMPPPTTLDESDTESQVLIQQHTFFTAETGDAVQPEPDDIVWVDWLTKSGTYDNWKEPVYLGPLDAESSSQASRARTWTSGFGGGGGGGGAIISANELAEITGGAGAVTKIKYKLFIPGDDPKASLELLKRRKPRTQTTMFIIHETGGMGKYRGKINKKGRYQAVLFTCDRDGTMLQQAPDDYWIYRLPHANWSNYTSIGCEVSNRVALNKKWEASLKNTRHWIIGREGIATPGLEIKYKSKRGHRFFSGKPLVLPTEKQAKSLFSLIADVIANPRHPTFKIPWKFPAIGQGPNSPGGLHFPWWRMDSQKWFGDTKPWWAANKSLHHGIVAHCRWTHSDGVFLEHYVYARYTLGGNHIKAWNASIEAYCAQDRHTKCDKASLLKFAAKGAVRMKKCRAAVPTPTTEKR